MKNVSKQALEAYHTLLKYSQLQVNYEIFFRNVDLSPESHIHQIYTQNAKNKSLPHLVLLHGFAGSAMSYIRTFHDLSQHFNVHALDHFGNGFSSRNVYDHNKNQQQILNLYVDSIEQWRKKTGVENMILAGHSFGGYIGSLYMLKHHQMVNRLILLSPVGTSSQEDINHELQNRKAESLKNKLTFSLIEKVFNMKIEPSQIFNIPLIGDFLVNEFLKSTIKLQTQQKQMWKQYIKYIAEQQSHLDKSFYQCFEWPFVSKLISISEILQRIVEIEKNKSIEFYYGENDWTESVAAKRLSSLHSNIHFEIIPNATHNMIFDFPHQVSQRIINPPVHKNDKIAMI